MLVDADDPRLVSSVARCVFNFRMDLGMQNILGKHSPGLPLSTLYSVVVGFRGCLIVRCALCRSSCFLSRFSFDFSPDPDLDSDPDLDPDVDPNLDPDFDHDPSILIPILDSNSDSDCDLDLTLRKCPLGKYPLRDTL